MVAIVMGIILAGIIWGGGEAPFGAVLAVIVLPREIQRQLLLGKAVAVRECPERRFKELQESFQKALLEGPLSNPEYYWGYDHIPRIGDIWGCLRRVLLNRGETDEWVHVAPLEELRRAARKGRLQYWVERFGEIEGEVCFSRFKPGENFLSSEVWVAAVGVGPAEAVWDVDVFSERCEATDRRIVSPTGREGAERTEAWVIPAKIVISHWVTNDENIYRAMLSEGILCQWLSPKGMESAKLLPGKAIEEVWEKECPWWNGQGQVPAELEAELQHSLSDPSLRRRELRRLRLYIEAVKWEASIDP